MAPTNYWHSIIAAESHYLPPDAARQLREIGFIVMPGPAIQGGCEQLDTFAFGFIFALGMSLVRFLFTT